MRFELRLCALSLIALVVGVSPGCNSSSGKPKVAIITNCIAEFWSICEAGAKKGSADFGVDVVFIQPNSNTVSDQTEKINDVLKLGVTGIAVSVIDPKEQTPSLKRIATEKHFLAMDNDAPDSGRLCYIGIDNYEAGKAVGRMVKEAMPNGGMLVMFIGSMSSDNAANRVGGVLDELAGQKGAKGPTYGQFTLYSNAPLIDETKEDKAQENAKDVLEKLKDTPNIVMVGLYAYNPKAILQAARAKGVVGKVKIVGFDEDWVTLEGIAKGEIVGTVVQDPFMYGYKSVEVLAALAKGDKSKATTSPIPYRKVTKDGGPEETVNGTKVVNLKVADFKAKLEADIASGKK